MPSPNPTEAYGVSVKDFVKQHQDEKPEDGLVLKILRDLKMELDDTSQLLNDLENVFHPALSVAHDAVDGPTSVAVDADMAAVSNNSLIYNKLVDLLTRAQAQQRHIRNMIERCEF